MPSVTGLLDKWLHRQKPEDPPPITTRTAVGFLVLYTVLYVAPFYLSSWTRPSANLSRDAPSVIRARVASVTLSCAFCAFLTLYILTVAGKTTLGDALHLMGYWPIGLAEALRATFFTMVLFLGPLFEHLVVEAGWRSWLKLQPLKDLFEEWTTWRNIVAGPVTEEILFRSSAVPLMLLARTPVTKTIFLSPVVFGLAHIHHFYEFRLTNPRVSIGAAVARSVFQLAYTTLFGAYATFLYLRTGSLLAVCLVHAFCNCMGLPRVWGRVQRHEPEDETASTRDARRENSPLWWSLVYYILLVTGAALWYRGLWTWTRSEMELSPMAG